MRQVTPEEVQTWTALARQYGFVDAHGNFALGRYLVESAETGQLFVRFVTPVPAGLEDADLRPPPPILFDRTPAGEIVLPGRWWQLTFERLGEATDVTADVRQKAAQAARVVAFGDAFLPADTDTIRILAPDREGHLVPHEALKPGTMVAVRIGPK